ncbi:hypothetical protein F4819DRAFT_120229 [Hypoxylon fuscum]|nr:hypothetical protein F4819DRAFT_120229 [Hypoxylon fuscum]
MTSRGLPPRPVLPPEEVSKGLACGIDVYHPAYFDRGPLLTFGTVDEPGGIHYNVVYYACCIVAGNVWDEDEGRNRLRNNPPVDESQGSAPPRPAFLSLHSDPDKPSLEIPDDNILRSTPTSRRGHYYFHVPGYDDCRYPITPNFNNWRFPTELPIPWRSAKTESTFSISTEHNGSCRITGQLSSNEFCYVIPQSASKWFRKNRGPLGNHWNDEMDTYKNKMVICRDAHYLLDNGNLVLFPLKVGEEYHFHTRIFDTELGSRAAALEAINKYHNYKCLPLHGISSEYLFARFAWALFSPENIYLFRHANTFNLRLSGDSWSRQEIIENDSWVCEEIIKEMHTSDPGFPFPRGGYPKAAPKIKSRKRTYSQIDKEDDDDDDEEEKEEESDATDDSSSIDSFYPDYMDRYEANVFRDYYCGSDWCKC